MSEVMHLSVLSPERRLVEEVSVDEVILSGSEGQIQILPGHAPFIGTLQAGFFRYRLSNGEITLGVMSRGFFQVDREHVYVMAKTFELMGEISLERARKAQMSAEENLQTPGLSERDFKRYQLKLQRALIRQQLAAGVYPFI